MRKSLRTLRKEGFRHVHILKSEDEVNAVSIIREPLWNDRTDEHGPFDTSDFWNEVDKIITDYKNHMKWLREHGAGMDL